MCGDRDTLRDAPSDDELSEHGGRRKRTVRGRHLSSFADPALVHRDEWPEGGRRSIVLDDEYASSAVE
jgi:hypothetical protein